MHLKAEIVHSEGQTCTREKTKSNVNSTFFGTEGEMRKKRVDESVQRVTAEASRSDI